MSLMSDALHLTSKSRYISAGSERFSAIICKWNIPKSRYSNF